MKVSVVYAGKEYKSWVNLELDDEATVGQAITQCGLLEKLPEIDIDTMKVGVYGKFTPLSKKLQEGDRVEIYRKIIRSLDDEDDDDDD